MQSDVNRLDGVVVGVLMGFGEQGEALVVFAGNRQEEAILARATVVLGAGDIGCEVALMFIGGDPACPMVIGRLIRPGPAVAPQQSPIEIESAGRRLELTAAEEIVLRCGKASITLTRAGKVLIRGAYISSWSSGAHRIKGGSVTIN